MSHGRCLLLLTLSVCVLYRPTIVTGQSSANGAQMTLHVLKITGGPAGTESNGSFVFTEERSVFSRSSDRDVFVMFQWDGTPGPHKLVAQWRSPDGGLTSTSSIDYVASSRRFGAYWQLNITTSMPLGMWSVEATVDGQPAGRFTFEIKDEAVQSAPVKRPFTQAELYERLSGVFVVLQRTIKNGRTVDATSGYLVNGGRIYTSLATLDGSDVVSALLPDGARRELSSVVSLSRAHDWAILPGGPESAPALPLAAADKLKVGDRCFSMEGSADGGRVLIEGSLTGQRQIPQSGRGFIASFVNGSGTPGAPVVNEFGELIGMLGGSGVPGATRLFDINRFRAELRGAPVISASAIRPAADPSPLAVSELQRRGDLIMPITGEEHVVSGGFAGGMVKGPVVQVSDQREEFKVTEKEIVTFVTWQAQARLKGQTVLRLYDDANRLVGESKPGKTDLRKNQLMFSSWRLPVPPTPGLYRADVNFDGQPMWRGFVRIAP